MEKITRAGSGHYLNVRLFISESDYITPTNPIVFESENDAVVVNQSSVQVNSVSRFEDNDRDGLVAEGMSFLDFGGAAVMKNNRYGVNNVKFVALWQLFILRC